jgi:hypothetical protein
MWIAIGVAIVAVIIAIAAIVQANSAKSDADDANAAAAEALVFAKRVAGGAQSTVEEAKAALAKGRTQAAQQVKGKLVVANIQVELTALGYYSGPMAPSWPPSTHGPATRATTVTARRCGS